jgi:hypothetical protein
MAVSRQPRWATFVGKTTIFASDHTLVPYAGQTFNFAPYQYYQNP